MSHLGLSWIAAFLGGLLMPDPWTIWRVWGQRHWLLWQLEMRHARLRMQAKVARWMYRGQLRDVMVKKGGRLVAK